ncbi:Regulator of rDNA transcription protein 15 [Capsicum baccatum]|uniref:Regulator of rDNA transcription protein 15 n=1 Tax=Capsicum baccatum TaxID=33114 RepID=A0A2G2V0K6_CAPBA|nr:Regulator of rDNA transcription protein 15 [Capsicum baccatum]
MVPWCHGALVPWCHGATVPSCLGAMVPVCHGDMVPRCLCATVTWCHVPVCHGALVPRFLCANLLWCHGACVTRCHGAAPPWCHGAKVPRCHSAMVPWCLVAMAPRCLGALLPWRHGAMVPCCLGTMAPRCQASLVPRCTDIHLDKDNTLAGHYTSVGVRHWRSLQHCTRRSQKPLIARTGNQNQTSFYPSVPHEISVLVELILGHLRYLLTDVPPQPNSPPDNVFRPDRPAERALGPKRGAVPRFRFTE